MINTCEINTLSHTFYNYFDFIHNDYHSSLPQDDLKGDLLHNVKWKKANLIWNFYWRINFFSLENTVHIEEKCTGLGSHIKKISILTCTYKTDFNF